MKKLSKMPPATASRGICRELLVPGLPDFTRLSATVGPIDISDMTSPGTSGRHLSKIEKRPKTPHSTALGRISRERFKGGSRYFTRLSGTVSNTSLPDMTLQSASGQLQNAIKYCTKVGETCSASKV